MTETVDVLVAIPAHNEADTIVSCLESVLASLTAARRQAVVGRGRVAVCAHRCGDDTAEAARAVLERSGAEWLITTEDAAMPVGAVRTRLIEEAVRRPPGLPSQCWVLSTDADTVVPLDWAGSLLGTARRSGADLVLGLADLDAWAADDTARRRYRKLLEAGIDGHQHHHAYAANLAVRWSLFEELGGFPAAPHGEEHALAARVRASGGRVVSPLMPVVRTSARMPGRAPHGLGSLLERLVSDGGTPPVPQLGDTDDHQTDDGESGAGQEDPPLTRRAG